MPYSYLYKRSDLHFPTKPVFLTYRPETFVAMSLAIHLLIFLIISAKWVHFGRCSVTYNEQQTFNRLLSRKIIKYSKLDYTHFVSVEHAFANVILYFLYTDLFCIYWVTKSLLRLRYKDFFCSIPDYNGSGRLKWNGSGSGLKKTSQNPRKDIKLQKPYYFLP